MIFAREISDSLTSLVKKIDEATAKNSSNRMASFVVFLGAEESLTPKLKQLADTATIEKCILSIVEKPDGPPGYDIPKEADLTVVLYVKHNVKANHAFKKGELNAKAIDAIVLDLKKILPETNK